VGRVEGAPARKKSHYRASPVRCPSWGETAVDGRRGPSTVGPVRARRVLVVAARVDDATTLVDGSWIERLGFEAPRVVTPASVDAALDVSSWDVLLVLLPMGGADVAALIERCSAKHPEIVSFAVSLSAPRAGDEELLAAVEAGARAVLLAHQRDLLAVLIERALREAEARRALGREQQLILAAAGEGIYGLDREGRTTFVNPAAARMIDWPVEELLGKPQHAILHHSRPDGSPYPRELCPIYAALRDGAVHHVDDEVFWRKDGTSFPVEYVSTPMIDEGGQVVGAVVIFRDVSRRRAMEHELAENLASLQATQTELETALEQLLSTEELTLAGQRMAGAAGELRALVRRFGADAPGSEDAQRDLAALETTLAALEYLSSEPAPARAPELDVGALVAAALRETPVSPQNPRVRAAGAEGDLRQLVALLAACVGGDADVRVMDDDGVPSVSFRGRRKPLLGADKLSYLFARRLAGRNFGSLETRHEPDTHVTFLLRLAPPGS
jgi:PAS domain S-box-containing protein